MAKQFKIPAGNVERLKAKLADLAKRQAKIAKKGNLADVTPISLIVGEKVVEFKKDPITNLPTPARIYFMCEVTGLSPKLAGWTFIATLQHEEGGTILRTVPTVELEDGALKAYRNSKPVCDHCKVNRKRNDTFVVRNDSNVIKQVGRNCLADFLGVQSPDHLARMAELLAAAGGMAEEYEGWGSAGEPVEDIGSFLAFAACAIRNEGWLSRTKAREQGSYRATADLAWAWMHPVPGSKDKNPLPEEQDFKLATDALAWTDEHLTNEESDKLSDYEHNLRVAVVGGIVTSRLAGITASLITYYERAIGKEILSKKAIAAGHVGTVGKRETFLLTLAQVFSVESQYGVTHIHKFVTAEGAVVVWKTGSSKLEAGEYKVKGTVKFHGDYKGTPQTILSRCVAEKVTSIEAQNKTKTA